MDKRRIGSLEVTVVGLGCNNFGWRIDERATDAVVARRARRGHQLLRHGGHLRPGRSEEFLGRALGARRREVVVATKFGMKMDEQRRGGNLPTSARPSRTACAASGPTASISTSCTSPIRRRRFEETLGAMEELVRAGKVREIGCSNFSAEQLRAVAGRFASVQNHYSLFHREPEEGRDPGMRPPGDRVHPVFPARKRAAVREVPGRSASAPGQPRPVGWGPKVFTEQNLRVGREAPQVRRARGHSVLELAMSWLAAQPAVASMIAGATTPEQVRSNAASANWKLTPAGTGGDLQAEAVKLHHGPGYTRLVLSADPFSFNPDNANSVPALANARFLEDVLEVDLDRARADVQTHFLCPYWLTRVRRVP